MKELKMQFKGELSWSFEKKRSVLKSDYRKILVLKKESNANATFKLDGRKYTIENKGFWNPKTTIYGGDRPLLVLTSDLWSGTGHVEFDGGNIYHCKVRRSPLTTLTFMADDERELLRYHHGAIINPKITMDIIDLTIPEMDMLLLIVLGCFSFMGIIEENDNDIIAMANDAIE